MREARTFRTIPTIRTIRTRLRQAAPWQAARKPWNGARGRNGFPHCSAGTPVVPQHTKKCGGIFTRCRGFSPARGLGRAAPCSFPAAVPSAQGRATKEREPTGENANFSDDSDDSDPAPPGCAMASSAQTMERGEGQERLSSLFRRGVDSFPVYGKMR